ncbi:hypothetical protein BGX38DRAFT_1231303 [Terfezia claveryi]|nr:hypothetical protein BGX38DRAFT_1231303 [Terfezia claveryi]
MIWGSCESRFSAPSLPSLTTPGPSLLCFFLILLMAPSRSAVLLFPLRPAFLRAAIATWESVRMRIFHSGAFLIPAISLSHTVHRWPKPMLLFNCSPSEHQPPPTFPASLMLPSV